MLCEKDISPVCSLHKLSKGEELGPKSFFTHWVNFPVSLNFAVLLMIPEIAMKLQMAIDPNEPQKGESH